MLLDKENSNQANTLNKEDYEYLDNGNIKDNKNKNILQNDTIKLSINNNDTLNNKNQIIISYQIQSKYKTKFFKNLDNNNNLNNKSISKINELINSNMNNNCDKFIFFTNLKEKENLLASTTNASNSKL